MCHHSLVSTEKVVYFGVTFSKSFCAFGSCIIVGVKNNQIGIQHNLCKHQFDVGRKTSISIIDFMYLSTPNVTFAIVQSYVNRLAIENIAKKMKL